jgi:hypothetical protein
MFEVCCKFRTGNDSPFARATVRSHPDDLNKLNNSLQHPLGATLSCASWASAFLAVCDGLEPNLVFATDDDRVNWLTYTASVRHHLSRWNIGVVIGDPRSDRVSPAVFTDLAALAQSAWRGPSTGAIRPLPWISDGKCRGIAERDLSSLRNARKTDEVKSALILAGSVVETVLCDLFDRDRAACAAAAAKVMATRSKTNPRVWGRFDPAKIEGWTLAQMIGVAGPDGLGVLSSRAEAVATAIREWRNFVHPREERDETTSSPLGANDAVQAEALAETVLQEVERWFKSRASGTAPP